MGGGKRFMGTQTHLPPKFSFSTDFGHFISKVLENAKFANVSRKKILKYHNFWRDVPADFSTVGTRPPAPAFDTHVSSLQNVSDGGAKMQFCPSYIFFQEGWLHLLPPPNPPPLKCDPCLVLVLANHLS